MSVVAINAQKTFLFKLKVQFDGDELTEFFIQCTFCNKFVHCQIYEVQQNFFTKKEILPFYKSCRVSSCWSFMDDIKKEGNLFFSG